jgi:hypothetical protein
VSEPSYVGRRLKRLEDPRFLRGVDHLDMPLTRERLWRALRSAGTDR